VAGTKLYGSQDVQVYSSRLDHLQCAYHKPSKIESGNGLENKASNFPLQLVIMQPTI